MLGCKAAAGIPVSDISKETKISRTCIYQQKASVQNYMESLDKAENHALSINIDKGFIERMVLSLSLDCHASAEGIQRHFASYLLSEAGDRSADTWQLFMEERKDHGLGLEVSISDAGIPKVFPDICVQPDIFHELRSVGAELARLERKAEKLIADEAALENEPVESGRRKRHWNGLARYTKKWIWLYRNMTL